jgi:AcrR family transcriptional regulator
VIFYYFRNKADILTALCEETFTGLLAQFQEIEGKITDPVERLLAASRAFVAFGTEHPHHYRVILSPPRTMDGVDSVIGIGMLGEGLFSTLGRLYRACCDTGDFRPGDPVSAGLSWWNSLSGLVIFFNTHGRSTWVDRRAILDHTLNVLVLGNREAGI